MQPGRVIASPPPVLTALLLLPAAAPSAPKPGRKPCVEVVKPKKCKEREDCRWDKSEMCYNAEVEARQTEPPAPREVTSGKKPCVIVYKPKKCKEREDCKWDKAGMCISAEGGARPTAPPAPQVVTWQDGEGAPPAPAGAPAAAHAAALGARNSSRSRPAPPPALAGASTLIFFADTVDLGHGVPWDGVDVEYRHHHPGGGDSDPMGVGNGTLTMTDIKGATHRFKLKRKKVRKGYWLRYQAPEHTAWCGVRKIGFRQPATLELVAKAEDDEHRTEKHSVHLNPMHLDPSSSAFRNEMGALRAFVLSSIGDESTPEWVTQWHASGWPTRHPSPDPELPGELTWSSEQLHALWVTAAAVRWQAYAAHHPGHAFLYVKLDPKEVPVSSKAGCPRFPKCDFSYNPPSVRRWCFAVKGPRGCPLPAGWAKPLVISRVLARYPGIQYVAAVESDSGPAAPPAAAPSVPKAVAALERAHGFELDGRRHSVATFCNVGSQFDRMMKKKGGFGDCGIDPGVQLYRNSAGARSFVAKYLRSAFLGAEQGHRAHGAEAEAEADAETDAGGVSGGDTAAWRELRRKHPLLGEQVLLQYTAYNPRSAFLRQVDPKKDAPGEYVTVAVDGTGVEETVERGSKKIGVLSPGIEVQVVEVVRMKEAQRLRGRIVPAGWISMRDLSDGFEWVRQVKPVSEEAVRKIPEPCVGCSQKGGAWRPPFWTARTGTPDAFIWQSVARWRRPESETYRVPGVEFAQTVARETTCADIRAAADRAPAGKAAPMWEQGDMGCAALGLAPEASLRRLRVAARALLPGVAVASTRLAALPGTAFDASPEAAAAHGEWACLRAPTEPSARAAGSCQLGGWTVVRCTAAGRVCVTKRSDKGKAGHCTWSASEAECREGLRHAMRRAQASLEKSKKWWGLVSNWWSLLPTGAAPECAGPPTCEAAV